jgi:hypothetical protein
MKTEIDKKTRKLASNLDPFYIIDLVNDNPNDMILGKLVREYLLNTKKHISNED